MVRIEELDEKQDALPEEVETLRSEKKPTPATVRAAPEAGEDATHAGPPAASHDDSDDSDDSDDDLPPLEDMSLRSSAAVSPEKEKTAPSGGAANRPEGQAVVGGTPAPKKPALKRGFFDAKPARQRAAKPQPKAASKEEDADAIPTISGKASRAGDAKSIPSFMRVEQPEGAAALEKVKEKLVHEMRPTPEMMSTIQGNGALMEGFDDPEVMAAVADIAKNPSSIAKYKHNRKVMRFYQHMASMMADKMNTKAEEQERGVR